jgi:alkanesulfonate monooxygenase SsuD/methylene tetrahydromethanopterin reductase-like flavin-dependent oxidoreductase (luciferase family)
MYKQSTLFGDPKHARECLEAVLDLGVTEISLVTQMPGLAQDKILESMRLFAREVMPHY